MIATFKTWASKSAYLQNSGEGQLCPTQLPQIEPNELTLRVHWLPKFRIHWLESTRRQDMFICSLYLSGEQNCSVIVLSMPVTGRIVLLLPVAEIPQGEGGIRGHIRSLLLIIDDHYFHYHQANGVLDTGMLVQFSSHRQEGKEVVLESTAMELCHRLVCYK